jgi:hypothetical protein
LWDLTTGQCLKTFRGHTDRVMSVCVSPDGRSVLSGGWDETVRLWDLATGRCLKVLEVNGHGYNSHGEVNLVGICPKGAVAFAAGEGKKQLRLWDLRDGRSTKSFRAPLGVFTSACFTPSGHWMVTGGAGGGRTLCLWDLANGDMWNLAENVGPIFSVSISPDGSWVLAGTGDGTLRLWELDWDYAFPGWADWDEAARPYLEAFLTLRYANGTNGNRRNGRRRWSTMDFERLIEDLQRRDLGWLKTEGVRRNLDVMIDNWVGPQPLPWSQQVPM